MRSYSDVLMSFPVLKKPFNAIKGHFICILPAMIQQGAVYPVCSECKDSLFGLRKDKRGLMHLKLIQVCYVTLVVFHIIIKKTHLGPKIQYFTAPLFQFDKYQYRLRESLDTSENAIYCEYCEYFPPHPA